MRRAFYTTFACQKQAIRRAGAPLKATDPVVSKPPTTTKGASLVDSIAADSLERNGFEAEAQRVARNAIMEIRLFPDLIVALRSALGYGPHVDMLQHFCYWMHPRHPKMQSRWTMYKTYAEWREECSLSDRQVRKGRKVLHKRGLVTEKKINYGRIDYRVDWVALAKALSLDTNSVQTDEVLDDFDLFDDNLSLYANSGEGQFGRYSGESNLDAISIHANAGEHAGEYVQKNSPLHGVPEPAFAEPGATEKNRDKEQKERIEAPPSTDKRHSQDAEPPKPEIAKEVEIKVWDLIFGLPDETDVSRFADQHIADRLDADGEAFTVKRVAERAREHLGRDEPLEACIPFVQRCLDNRRAEGMQVDSAS
jgi:hypothetical protein